MGVFANLPYGTMYKIRSGIMWRIPLLSSVFKNVLFAILTALNLALNLGYFCGY